MLLIFLIFHLSLGDVVIVETPYGTVAGKQVTVLDGCRAEAFLGIPYAIPPCGSLRFERPQPILPWQGTLKATDYSPACPDMFTPFQSISEDCLTINIVRPIRPSLDSRGFPVMFFIHGGGFYQGSSILYHYSGPVSNLIPHGVIFVSINYRLGPFGWVTTGDSDYPGNQGLWDQIEALRFHKQIIASFGGDPERITIFGESAGGVSVSWLTLTPLTDGLFAKSISMSGSALSIWGHNEQVIESTQVLLRCLKCPISGPAAIACLKTKTRSEIFEALKITMPTIIRRDSLNIVYWGPRLGGAGEILPGGSLKQAIALAPRRPQLIGVNTMEMLLFAVPNLHLTSTPKGLIPLPKLTTISLDYNTFACTLQAIFGNRQVFGPNAQLVAHKIIQFYSKIAQRYPNNCWLHAYLKVLTDVDFTVPAIREARVKAAAGWPLINMYRYSYDNAFMQIFFDSRVQGAAHAMELFHIFDYALEFMKPFPSAESEAVSRHFICLFLDVVLDRVPLPQVTAFQAPYTGINVQRRIFEDMDPEIVLFWDSLAREFQFDWPSGDFIFDKSRKTKT